MKVYIAGPMTGIEDYNYPAFHRAAAKYRDQGYEVINPAETEGGDQTKPYDFYLRRDIQDILTVDVVVVLPGWEKSKGASLEVHIARVLGLPVWTVAGYPIPENPYEGESALQEAQRLVHGNRGADYGHPIDDFARTGRMWGAILGLPDAVPPERVGLCMAAVKISREVNKPKRDNRVDLAGYAETVNMIEERKAGIS